MVPYRYDPNKQWVYKSDISSFLKNRFPQWDLVMLRQANGNFTISEWRDRWVVLEDLVTIGLSPQIFNNQHVDRLDYLLNGPSTDPRKRIREAEQIQLKMQMEVQEEEQKARKYLARKTGEPDPLNR